MLIFCRNKGWAVVHVPTVGRGRWLSHTSFDRSPQKQEARDPGSNKRGGSEEWF